MNFTVREFEDLVHIIETKPEWRGRLKRALFPDLDLEKSFKEMNEAIARLAIGQDALRKDVNTLRQDFEIVKQDVAVLKQDVTVLKQDVAVLKQDVKGIKKDVSDLKGRSQEEFYRQKAGAVFSLFLRKGNDATDWVADQLYEQMNAGNITLAELKQVMSADLLWSAEMRNSKRRVILVMEASWYAEQTDVERAATRAEILRRINIDAVPVVGGHEWDEAIRQQAIHRRVATTTNGRIDDDSWLKAMQSNSTLDG